MSTGLCWVIAELYRVIQVIPSYPGYTGYERRVMPGYCRVIPRYAELWLYGLWAPGYSLTGYWEITWHS